MRNAVPMSRILLIEDSEESQLIIRRALGAPDRQIILARTLAEARAQFAQYESQGGFQFILLDLSLPDGDGFSLLDELLADGGSQIPIFLLTSSQDLNAKVTAVNLGVDDYLVKPFNPIELKARVEMRLRKSFMRAQTTNTVRRGALILDHALMKAQVQENGRVRALDLTAKEFRILSFLSQNEGSTYSREDLVRAVWGPTLHVLARTVDSHICAIRRKLGTYAHYLQSVPGVGYRLLTQQSAPSAQPRSPSPSL
jgi:DNA-binding response OmpR family regulator